MKETKTFIKFKSAKQDNFPVQIVVHHSGGIQLDPKADTSHHTASGMEAQHLSMGWEGLGYHYVIHKDGEIWKGRPEHYHGAHVKEQNMNTKSLGICLAGNFDVTLPTKEQETSLEWLIGDIKTRYRVITNDKIYPHRHFLGVPPYKSCYGSKLADDWARKLSTTSTTTTPAPVVKSKEALLKQLEDLKQAIINY